MKKHFLCHTPDTIYGECGLPLGACLLDVCLVDVYQVDVCQVFCLLFVSSLLPFTSKFRQDLFYSICDLLWPMDASSSMGNQFCQGLAGCAPLYFKGDLTEIYLRDYKGFDLFASFLIRSSANGQIVLSFSNPTLTPSSRKPRMAFNAGLTEDP